MDEHVYGAQLEVELVAITPEPEKVIEQAGRACELMLALLKQHAPTCFEDIAISQ